MLKKRIVFLSVGINKFTNFPNATLRGCVHDAEAMERFFRESIGGNGRRLVNQEAKRENIMVLMRAGIELGDVFCFSMSSHGSQVRDANGDEPDKLDGAYITYDTDKNFKTVIRDDDLYALFSEYPNKEIMVWMDTCHSGEAYRALSFNLKTRKVLPVHRYLENLDAASGKVNDKTSNYKELDNVVFHAACQATESACDAYIERDFCGAFTHFWLQAYLADNNRSSRKEICDSLAKLKKEYGQTPALICSPRKAAESEFSL
jgi:metacaspase-1